jgi:hypothetical protein
VQEGVEHGEAVVQLGRLLGPLLITVRLQGMKLGKMSPPSTGEKRTPQP